MDANCTKDAKSKPKLKRIIIGRRGLRGNQNMSDRAGRDKTCEPAGRVIGERRVECAEILVKDGGKVGCLVKM